MKIQICVVTFVHFLRIYVVNRLPEIEVIIQAVDELPRKEVT